MKKSECKRKGNARVAEQDSAAEPLGHVVLVGLGQHVVDRDVHLASKHLLAQHLARLEHAGHVEQRTRRGAHSNRRVLRCSTTILEPIAAQTYHSVNTEYCIQ